MLTISASSSFLQFITLCSLSMSAANYLFFLVYYISLSFNSQFPTIESNTSYGWLPKFCLASYYDSLLYGFFNKCSSISSKSLTPFIYYIPDLNMLYDSEWWLGFISEDYSEEIGDCFIVYLYILYFCNYFKLNKREYTDFLLWYIYLLLVQSC